MIYVHVPFCKSFCTYCDFYSEVPGCAERNYERYADEICAEALRRKDEIKDSLNINTLYIGGGTPSVLPLSVLSRIAGQLKEICGEWSEFTVEVNPDDITPSYAAGLQSLGVSRVSMGIQSLSDGMLRWMGRRHNAEGALKAFRTLREAGFRNLSVDIIFGISHLSDDTLEKTVRDIISCGPEHISAYQLSIEEGSALARKVEKGQYTEADEEQCRRQYLLICGLLKEAGYIHYEISNWARPGFEAVHNSAYWARAPYVGLGPGAHSLRIKDSQIRSWNSQVLSGWTSEEEILTPEEIREEEIMLGLRTSRGWNGRRLSEEEWFISDSIIEEIII